MDGVFSLHGHARPSAPESTDFPGRARIFMAVSALVTAIVTVPHLVDLQANAPEWGMFLLLAAAASLAQLFVVTTTRNQVYHTTAIFFVAGALLLPPEFVALLALVSHIPDWLRTRYPWYIQTFNILNFTLALMATWGVAHLVETYPPTGNGALAVALTGAAAAITFVVVNQIGFAIMIPLARGHNPLSIITVESLTTDIVLACLGVAVARFWHNDPWLIPFAVAPLFLIHRSLSVPALQEEARVDPKTGLFNARHFAAVLREELTRAERFERPMSVIMADLDLLREINNTYGHLAGDAVLKGVADIFRTQLREYDVPARFGGEEFAMLLPETPADQALAIAERIRRSVAAARFEIETSSEPIRASISLGVAGYPKDGTDVNELIHQADLAVYRAKLQGRNRALGASSEPLLIPAERAARLAAVPEEHDFTAPAPRAMQAAPETDRREADPPRRHLPAGPRFLALSPTLAGVVALVSASGIGLGLVAVAEAGYGELAGLVAVVIAVGVGQALALELEGGSISVSAVGALAGVALFGPRAALPLAITMAIVAWSASRHALYYVFFNVGALSLASLTAGLVFTYGEGLSEPGVRAVVTAIAGLVAGGAYFVVNTGLISGAMAIEGHHRWRDVWNERFSWLLPHYVAFGAVAGAIALAYEAIGLYSLAVFVLPLLLMRKTMAAYLQHTQRNASKLREAAATIRNQNASLEQANRLLRERSTAAMESLSATVDARDAYTAGHSRRVQNLALAIGRELGLSQPELDLLGHAALFHDIGKLAVPDAVLLKPEMLTDEEWELMQRHAAEGARIIDRLGFLNDAVPAIRHHHERFDGTGYPDRLGGEEIPLGARIIHVADALDSMRTTRIYRAARPAQAALEELRIGAGTQFCPRCVGALERLVQDRELEEAALHPLVLACAS
jgi:diguanylate cyclase (GGDEF)-like protein/putative nucleotidyltransferase with HDIG domain